METARGMGEAMSVIDVIIGTILGQAIVAIVEYLWDRR